jgi:hypothetical protein
LFGQRLQPFAIHIAQDERRALFGEASCSAFADTRCRPGDDDDLAGKSGHVLGSCLAIK